MQREMTPVLGILGGLGYESTIHFQNVFMARLRRRMPTKRREVVPTLVWNVVPPGAQCSGLDDELVRQYVLGGERCLLSIGATVCALPCHTHCHVTGSTIISMYDSLEAHLREHYDGETIGLLATDDTVKNLKASLPTIEFVLPPEGEMEGLIHSIEKGHTHSACAKLQRITMDLDSSTIIVGCSDISLCLRRMRAIRRLKTFVDSHRVLADAVVDRISASL